MRRLGSSLEPSGLPGARGAPGKPDG